MNLKDKLKRYCEYSCNGGCEDIISKCKKYSQLNEIKKVIIALPNNSGFLVPPPNKKEYYKNKKEVVEYIERKIFEEIIDVFNFDYEDGLYQLYEILPILEDLTCFYEFKDFEGEKDE